MTGGWAKRILLGEETFSHLLQGSGVFPPDRPLKLLDIGCGEGRNAIFFARNGYHVTAFDSSSIAVDKTKRYADEAGVSVDVFQADVVDFRLEETYDVLFSSGVLHYIPEKLRPEIFQNYKDSTAENGMHVFSVFVKKPFIAKVPDAEPTAHFWISGELFARYWNWEIDYCTEDIFDCMSSGVPYKHAANRVIARKV